MKILMLATLLAASGCASYTYTKHADGSCTVEIASMRTVAEGDLTISGCDVDAGAKGLSNEATLNAIGALLRPAP